MRPFHHVALLVFGFAMLASCAGPISLSRDFVTLAGHSRDEDFRAVTGDDARVWLRRFRDPNGADLEFWVQALQHDFVQQRGYELIGDGDVRDADGRRGHWFECATNVDGERVGYLIALWAEDGDVVVVEFGARGAVFEARVDEVRRALRTVRG